MGLNWAGYDGVEWNRMGGKQGGMKGDEMA